MPRCARILRVSLSLSISLLSPSSRDETLEGILAQGEIRPLSLEGSSNKKNLKNFACILVSTIERDKVLENEREIIDY